MVRRAARRDDNHREVVDALRKAGAFVQDLASVGNGCFDLLAGAHGRWGVIEVKDGDKVPSARKLTDHEVRWVLELNNRAPAYVVTSAAQAVEVVNGWRQ